MKLCAFHDIYIYIYISQMRRAREGAHDLRDSGKESRPNHAKRLTSLSPSYPFHVVKHHHHHTFGRVNIDFSTLPEQPTFDTSESNEPGHASNSRTNQTPSETTKSNKSLPLQPPVLTQINQSFISTSHEETSLQPTTSTDRNLTEPGLCLIGLYSAS